MSTHEQNPEDGDERAGGGPPTGAGSEHWHVDLTSYQSPAAPEDPQANPSPPDVERAEPAAASARGVHIAWVKLQRAGDATAPFPQVSTQAVAPPTQAPVTAPPPPTSTPAQPAPTPAPVPTPPAPTPAPVPTPAAGSPPRTVPAAPEVQAPEPRPAPRRDHGIEEDYEDPGVPSAIGRLAAVVVTLGLGWALAVAMLIWIIARILG